MNITELYDELTRIESKEKFTENLSGIQLVDYEEKADQIRSVICFLEDNGFDTVEKIIVSPIDWNAPKSANLPKKVEIDITLNNLKLLEDFDGFAENLCDYLSDIYEYYVEGFCARLSPKPTKTQSLSR